MIIGYTYNNQGYRIEETISIGIDVQVIKYTLTGDKVLHETDGTYAIIYTYDYDGTIISFNYDSDITDTNDGVDYFYVRNQQGDITKLLDKDGNVELEYIYDAWGNIINWNDIKTNTLATINQYTYRGYRYDSEISMYYLNSRFYNPIIGRFINSDGLIGQQGNILGHNMYAYSYNNPIMFTDDSGYLPRWLKITALVVGAVLVVAAVTVLTCGVGTATLAGAIAVGAAQGALIGAGIGIVVGGAIGYAMNGSEGMIEGAILGFGIGALLGAIIGGTIGGLRYTPSTSSLNINSTGKTFQSPQHLEEHFLKHGGEFGYSSPAEYLDGAQYVINNGTFIPEMNGYIRFYGAAGKANYAFAGMNQAGQITTFGIRSVLSLARTIPYMFIV